MKNRKRETGWRWLTDAEKAERLVSILTAEDENATAEDKPPLLIPDGPNEQAEARTKTDE